MDYLDYLVMFGLAVVLLDWVFDFIPASWDRKNKKNKKDKEE